MTTQKSFALIVLIALVSLVSLASSSPAAPAPVPTTAEAGASLALAAGAVAAAMAERRRETVFTLIGACGYGVDEARPRGRVRKDNYKAFADESGEEYLQRLVVLVDEDDEPETLFGMLWDLQYNLGIAWSRPGENGYFKYQTRPYELTKIADNEYILDYIVDGELVLGGSGSDEYYHDVCKIVIDGNRLTLYEYPNDPDDKYVILEVE